MEGDKKNNIEEIKQKALKITEALYRTTDLFYDVEPLKWSLRETSISILEIFSGIDGRPEYEQAREADKLNNLVNKLFLKLELASSGTFISKANFDVLEREYMVLTKTLKQNFLPQILLDNPIMDKLSDSISDNISKPGISEPIKIYEGAIEKTVANIEVNAVLEKSDSKRQKTIIGALKIKGPSSVSDLAMLFDGTISGKTVQRELGVLVASGNIKQEGERRWRRYFV